MEPNQDGDPVPARTAWYTRVLQRYNEAIALDYLVLFRLTGKEDDDGEAGVRAGPPIPC